MSILSAAEKRRWAHDMERAWRGEWPIEKLGAYCKILLAEAELEDVVRGVEFSGMADEAFIEQNLPILGEVTIRGGKRTRVEFPYNGEGERAGVHVAFDFHCAPDSREKCGSLCRLYIGTELTGPLYSYDAEGAQWWYLRSNGNFGKKYAHGGTWSAEKMSVPPVEMLKIIELARKEAKYYEALEAAEAKKREHEEKVEVARAKVREAYDNARRV